jgi:hypothetical protein
VRHKIFVPVDESSIAGSGHDGVAVSGTINPDNMAERRTEHDEILAVRQVSKLLKLHLQACPKRHDSGTKGRKSWRFLKSEILKWFEKKTSRIQKSKPPAILDFRLTERENKDRTRNPNRLSLSQKIPRIRSSVI